MSTDTGPKLLHTWEVAIDQTVDETTDENRDGQVVKVTKKVTKPVATRFAIKQPTRRELRAAELFYGKRQNWYVTNGFLTRSIMVNKHLDLNGGVVAEKVREYAAKLAAKHVAIEAEMAIPDLKEEVKADIRKRLAAVRNEMIDLNAANESVFSQTAEARAQNDLTTWFSLFLTLIDRGGKWAPYFEGDSYEEKEESMWQLEEKNDSLYNKAIDTISLHTGVFLSGGSTPELFVGKLKWIEEEMEQHKKALEQKAAPASETPPVEPVPSV